MPEPAQWRRSIHLRRAAKRVRGVLADLGGRMQPAKVHIAERARDVTARAARDPLKHRATAMRRVAIVAAGDRLWRLEAELILAKRGQLRRDEVGWRVVHVH